LSFFLPDLLFLNSAVCRQKQAAVKNEWRVSNQSTGSTGAIQLPPKLKRDTPCHSYAHFDVVYKRCVPIQINSVCATTKSLKAFAGKVFGQYSFVPAF